MSGLHAVLLISRFDPHADREAHWQRYQVTMPESSTVLEALMQIQDHQDGSLAFRRSCRHAICGACGMRINGCARLACNFQLQAAVEQAQQVDRAAHAAAAGPGAEDDAEAAIRVEPLATMPVIKDLIVDMAGFWQKLRGVQPWLQSLDEHAHPDRERLMSPADWTVIADGLLCLECGCCYSECCSVQANEEFVGPTALTKAFRYAFDVRDEQAHRRMFDLSGEHGLWECTRCYYCSHRCPKHLRVRELIERLDRLAWGEGLRTDAGARRSAAVLESVRESGRLDERLLPLRAEGILHALAHAPDALRAVAAGKLDVRRPEPVDRPDDVRRVAEASEERQ